ncbi:MAG: hypothetical protein MHPSP_000501 [Paramarteilia canceri]
MVSGSKKVVNLGPLRCRALLSKSIQVSKLTKRLKKAILSIRKSDTKDLTEVDLRYKSGQSNLLNVDKVVEMGSSIGKITLALIKTGKIDGYLFIDMSENKENVDITEKTCKIRLVSTRISKYIHIKSIIDYFEMQNKDLKEINMNNVVMNRLDLSKNMLEKVKFNSFETLYEVNLSNNNLKVFPKSIYSLKSLKKLNLSHNQIFHISPLISKLKNFIISIDLSFNCIEVIPREVLELNIKNLDMSHQQKLNIQPIPLLKLLNKYSNFPSLKQCAISTLQKNGHWDQAVFTIPNLHFLKQCFRCSSKLLPSDEQTHFDNISNINHRIAQLITSENLIVFSISCWACMRPLKRIRFDDSSEN